MAGYLGHKTAFLMPMLLCLLVISSVTHCQHSAASFPDLKVTYQVHYDSTGVELVSDACGRYYAEHFLQQFWSLQSNLSSLCVTSQPPNDVTVSVTVDMVAMVHIIGSSVKLDIYVHISGSSQRSSPVTSTGSSPHHGTRVREMIALCNTTLENNLQDITPYEDDVHTFRNIPARVEENKSSPPPCPAAIMADNRLEWSSSSWVCPETYNLTADTWTCDRHQAVTDPPSSACPDMVAMCFRALQTIPDTTNACNRPNWSSNVSISACQGLVNNVGYEPQRAACQNQLDDLEESLCGPPPTTPTPPPTTPTPPSQETTHQHTTGSQPDASTVDVETTSAGNTSPDSSPIDEPATPGGQNTSPGMPLLVGWGVQIRHNVTRIDLTEGNGEKMLTFRAWANVSSVCEGESDCQLSAEIRFSHGTHPMCRSSGASIAQVVVGQHSGAARTRAGESGSFCSIPLTAITMETDLTLPLKAKLDSKYDGSQTRTLNIALRRVINGKDITEEPQAAVTVSVSDEDSQATCSSINDPHIGTFDGLEYNNYYEGEFVLYKHKADRFQVHTVYQRCGQDVPASCNCAVAIQSDDDVILIDKCARKTPTFNGLGPADPSTVATPLTITLFLNGQLTPGTKIFEENEGKKISVYLPLGTYVKILVDGNLLNVWVIASPNDKFNTVGLCGSYDSEPENDLTFRNGSYMTIDPSDRPEPPLRIQPREFVLDWRVTTEEGSILRGVGAATEPYRPAQYCECEQEEIMCGYAADIETCDIYANGLDRTEYLVMNNAVLLAPPEARNKLKLPEFPHNRQKRQSGSVINVPDQYPLDIDNNFIPPVPSWHGHWNALLAREECETAIKYSPAGQMCSAIPGLNVEQEIQTCVEDIQITGNISWVSSAKDALVEKCMEEVHRNPSIPADLANNITNTVCIHDCNKNGHCDGGVCMCKSSHTGSDCSLARHLPPEISQMPRYGLCDIRYMRCSSVIIYGQNFINSNNLTCHLQTVRMTEDGYVVEADQQKFPAFYINFNAVQCNIPEVMSYLVTVSNDGVSPSNPLLFIPYDSVCNSCSTNSTSCIKVVNSCVIDEQCYAEGDLSDDGCLMCSPRHNELEWTSTDDTHCDSGVGPVYVALPDWLVAVMAAVAGSLVGVMSGVAMYWLCCKTSQCHQSKGDSERSSIDCGREGVFPGVSPAIEDTILHRNHNLPAFSPGGRLATSPPHRTSLDDAYFHNDGRGVENGVNDNTYF